MSKGDERVDHGQRREKGREIAARLRLQRDGSTWTVPSQAGRGVYHVDMAAVPPTCTCPDYELSGTKCKHIYAVEFAEQVAVQMEAAAALPATGTDDAAPELPERTLEPVAPTPTHPKRPTYSQDWPAYNAAQVYEKAHFQALLHDLCSGIQNPEQSAGRPRLSYRDMVFAAAFKVYSTVSARRFMTDLRAAHEHGYLTHLPCYNAVLKYLELPELTPLLRALIEEASGPLAVVEKQFAVDSTGFSTCRHVRWFDAKYGGEREGHEWLKAHLMCGVLTNVVTSVEITGREGADYPQFAPLLEATARRFTMEEVSADKAYSGRTNLRLVHAHNAVPYIPFRANSKGRMSSMAVWEQLYHFYHLHRETFLEHYHRRSLVESTVNMIKAKFGAALRSKTETAQVNELLCKVLCHNICCVIQSVYELGIEPHFWAAAPT